MGAGRKVVKGVRMGAGGKAVKRGGTREETFDIQNAMKFECHEIAGENGQAATESIRKR